MEQREVWWADLGEPVGSVPGYQRPVVIVQADWMNATRIATIIVIPLTGNVKWANAPGNVRLSAKTVGLERDSIANSSQIVSIDKAQLSERIGKISLRDLQQIFAGIDIILGR